MLILPSSPLLALIIAGVFVYYCFEGKGLKAVSMPQEKKGQNCQATEKKTDAVIAVQPKPQRTKLEVKELFSQNNRINWSYCEPGVYQVSISNTRLNTSKMLHSRDIDEIETDIRDLFLRWSIKEKSLG